MSLPPPSGPASASTPAGWYADPWEPDGLRWWDGSAWSGFTEAEYARRQAHANPWAAGAVQAAAGPTRALARLLLFGPIGQIAGLAVSSSALRDAVRAIGDPLAPPQNRTNVPLMAAGQLVSLIGIVLLVLRIVWLSRTGRAARELGDEPRRSPELTAVGWLIPIVNLWWPYQGLRAVCPSDAGTRRRLGWWWALHLVGSVGAVVALMVTWSLDRLPAVLVMAVPTAAALTSAVLERGLVIAAHRAQIARIDLNAP